MNKKSFFRCFGNATLVFFIGACAQFGQQPALEQPADYSIADGKTQTAVRADWWRGLNDPVLNGLVERTLQQSPDLKVAAARIVQAQAVLGTTEAASKVQLGVQVSGAGMLLADRPDSQNHDAGRMLSGGVVGVQGSWLFDFWGKNRALAASALGRKQAAEYEWQQARIMLAHSVVAQYAAWQTLAEQQRIVQKRMETAAEIEKLLNQRIQAKLLPENAVYPIQQSQLQLQAQQKQLESRMANVRHALAVLSGSIPSALNNVNPAAIDQMPTIRVGRLRADILSRRPDIAAQKSVLTARYQDVLAARAEFYPNIEIKALAGLSYLDIFDVLQGSSKFVGILPALNLPLFTSGALQSKLSGRNAEYNEQVARYEQTVLTALRDAANATVDYQAREAEWALQQKAWVLSQKKSASVLRRVGAGLDNKLAYLQKEDETLQQQARVVQSAGELITAWSNVHAQLGGGFYQEGQ